MSLAFERVIAHRRIEPPDSLDFFPTPPWATRALFFHVLGRRAFTSLTVEDPACGEGHMLYPLEDFFGTVTGSDIHDYGIGASVRDFLDEAAFKDVPQPDWIVTNPPFGELTVPFMLRALSRARLGVAMFLRTTQVDGKTRYKRVFFPHPPHTVAHFVERVPLHKGRWEPDGKTFTPYSWFVWRLDRKPSVTATRWIPPSRHSLHYRRDLQRFGFAS